IDVPDLTADDLIAAAALRARGMRVEPVVWSDPAGGSDPIVARGSIAASEPIPASSDRGSAPDAVVIRSCWDYHLREPAFRAWLARLESAGVLVINAPDLVRWNLHKSYLADLQSQGIGAVPTTLIRRDDTRSLRDIIDGA